MELSEHAIQVFREVIWDYYAGHGRGSLPWRQPTQGEQVTQLFDPYHIMVSELMLQQTQVSRVIPKYESFLKLYPTVTSLASEPLGEVLRAWQGLGYNRRAKYLWLATQAIVSKPFPKTLEGLIALPGIGNNTAGAILAYAYNQPVIFIETNIRTVYIHHFLAAQSAISDTTIKKLVEQTLDHDNPREWYWALMDYGSYLKSATKSINHASKHFTKQSSFTGSRRQIRGQVIRLLSAQPMLFDELQQLISDERLVPVLNELQAEQLVRCLAGSYSLD